jgi:hypothetical protein
MRRPTDAELVDLLVIGAGAVVREGVEPDGWLAKSFYGAITALKAQPYDAGKVATFALRMAEQ